MDRSPAPASPDNGREDARPRPPSNSLHGPWRHSLTRGRTFIAGKSSEDSLQFGSLPVCIGNQRLAMINAVPGAFGQSGGDTINHSDTMSRLSRRSFLAAGAALLAKPDRKSTRLNSSHLGISYA